jgi:hypothetical protein
MVCQANPAHVNSLCILIRHLCYYALCNTMQPKAEISNKFTLRARQAGE